MLENNLKRNLKHDIPAGIVVFLVALPLCLGIAQASGANAITGVIAGIVGGIVIGSLSGSSLGVSGPAAGLASIIFSNLQEIRVEKLKDLGYNTQDHLEAVSSTVGNFKDFEALTSNEVAMDKLLALNGFSPFGYFLIAVVIAGIIQVLLGYLKLGIIAAYFPTSVIKGMLAAIGITLIMKQIPHGLGYDKDAEGSMSFSQPDGYNTFTEIFHSFKLLEWGAVIITVTSLALLIFWQTNYIKKNRILNLIPAPLLVVILGITFNWVYKIIFPELELRNDHLVAMPVFESAADFSNKITFPAFDYLPVMSTSEWRHILKIALTIAVVASLETLLSVEATDKLDPQKRVTPTNRELLAQGTGNIVSGLVGGLPLTQVIVRSSANVNSGGKTKLSAIFHGLLLFFSLLLIPGLLNLIPMASLAAILIMVGYKLASLKLLRQMYSLEHRQFIPFFITIVAILLSDLLVGIVIGLLVGIFYILKDNKGKEPYEVTAKYLDKESDGMKIVITFYEEVHYLSKNTIKIALNDIPPNSNVFIDGTQCKYISQDVIDAIRDFEESKAKDRNIKIEFQIKEEIYNEIDSSLLENMKL